jgi:hypothetical protein
VFQTVRNPRQENAACSTHRQQAHLTGFTFHGSQPGAVFARSSSISKNFQIWPTFEPEGVGKKHSGPRRLLSRHQRQDHSK